MAFIEAQRTGGFGLGFQNSVKQNNDNNNNNNNNNNNK